MISRLSHTTALRSPHSNRIQIEGSKGYTPELVLTMMLDIITRLNLHDRLEILELSLKNFQPSTSILPVLLQT